MCTCMYGFSNVWVCVCGGFVMWGYVCGFYNVMVCVCMSFWMSLPNSRRCNFILNRILQWLSQITSLPQISPPKSYTRLSSPHTIHDTNICSRLQNPNSIGWGMQIIKLLMMREERKPTRWNNIDDLLSIVDVDYWHCLNMFRASLCPKHVETVSIINIHYW